MELGQQPLFAVPAEPVRQPRGRGVPDAGRHNATGGTLPAAGRILACDPSSQKFGWSVVESAGPGRITRHASGRLSPSKASEAHDQYTQIVLNLVGVIERHQVGAIVFEVPTGNSGYRMRGMSAASYGRAVEIPHTIAVLRGLPWRAIDVATRKGDVSKSYTVGMVRRLLAYEARWEDEADALGLGCWFLLQS
jgi:Holliday junction resolvasome RuvABC endonuclease subunit